MRAKESVQAPWTVEAFGGTPSDSDMVPQPAEFDRVRPGGMCSCKRVHAPLSYGRPTIQQSSNVVAKSRVVFIPKESKGWRFLGPATTHLSQVRSVATLAVTRSDAECAADVRSWTEPLDVVGVGDGVLRGFRLAGGNSEVALGSRLDVDCLCVGETGELVRVQVQEVALEIRKKLQSN